MLVADQLVPAAMPLNVLALVPFVAQTPAPNVERNSRDWRGSRHCVQEVIGPRATSCVGRLSVGADLTSFFGNPTTMRNRSTGRVTNNVTVL